MRMQVILDSLLARRGSVPIWGWKKGDFRDWTSLVVDWRLSVSKVTSADAQMDVAICGAVLNRLKYTNNTQMHFAHKYNLCYKVSCQTDTSQSNRKI